MGLDRRSKRKMSLCPVAWKWSYTALLELYCSGCLIATLPSGRKPQDSAQVKAQVDVDAVVTLKKECCDTKTDLL